MKLTLALQILLDALETDVARRAKYQDTQEALYITAEAFLLSEGK